MSNDPNYNAGRKGHNAPANNNPGANHQWNQGRQAAERQRQQDQQRFNDWYNKK